MKVKKLQNKYPAKFWQSASPIGNGRLGALIMGSIFDERIILNHESLYDGGVYKDLPNISSSLAKIRKLMDEKRYKEAENFYVNALKENNYYANKGWFIPAFDLHIVFETTGVFNDYSRELDLINGLSSVKHDEQGSKVIREAFASFKDKVIVINLRKDKPFNVRFTLEPRDKADSLVENEGIERYVRSFKSKVEDKSCFAEIETTTGLKYSGIVKISETDGKVFSFESEETLNIDMQGKSNLVNFLEVKNATYLTLLIDISEKHASFDVMKKALEKVPTSYEELKARHTKLFSKQFLKTFIDISPNKNVSNEELLLNSFNGEIDTRLIEKMGDYGRYLLISSAYKCKNPPNLQGIWNGDYRPVWSCTYFNNENIQMCYWQALGGNLSDTLLPLFDLYDRFKDDYRLNAKNLYGCKGILLPLFMDNKSGKKDNLQPHVLYWTGSSAWISQIYYDYYQYTLDEDFLINRALPFMKESAEFYEDFYVEDENGYLKSYPADSPENRANGSFEGAKEISCCINPTMDFALLKELLTNLVDICEKKSIKEPKLNLWKSMLTKIPPYEINSDGALKEWMHKDFLDNYMHRHESHVYGLFPGREITSDNNKLIFDAIKCAIEKRLTIGLTEQTGWSIAHMANVFCRLGMGDKALYALSLLTRFCTNDNLFTFHNDDRNMGVTLKFLYGGKKPFQIDANMGFTSALYEMILYSNKEKISIFPALPSLLKKGKIKGLVAMGNVIVDLKWDENKATATLKSNKTKNIKLKVCGGYSNSNYKINEGYIDVDLSKGKQTFEFSRN